MILLDIIKISYEVIALIAVMGLCVFLWNRRSQKLPWLILLILLLMIVWRTVYGMNTSRYSSIFIFPAVLGVLIFGEFLENLFKKFFSEKCAVRALRICQALVVIACLMKTFLFDPAGNNILKAFDFIVEDSKKYSTNIILDSTLNLSRLIFYTKVPAVYFGDSCGDDKKRDVVLPGLLYNYSQLYENIYVFHKEESTERGGLKCFGLNLLKSYPVSRKNNKYWTIYRCEKIPKPFENKTIKSISNGDFSLLDNKPDVMQKDVELKGDSFAKEWFLNLNDGYADKCNAEVGIVEAWDGNALYMKSDSDITVCHQKFFPMQKNWLFFQYKTLQKSKFELRIYFYDKNQQFTGVKILDTVFFNKLDSLRDFIVPITEESDEKKSFFRISLRLDWGKILIDNVKFISL